MITEEEAISRRTAICDFELYGWGFIAALTYTQIANACNGIGPASWSADARKKLDKWLSTFRLAADVHDCRYTWDNDGTREKFDYANDELEKNCKILADEKYAWYNPLRYLARRAAHLVAQACRDFGWSAYKDAYSKLKKEMEN